MNMKNLDYYINLDERGEFFADVRDRETDVTVFEIHGFDIFEDGFMEGKKDMTGLYEHLEELGLTVGYTSPIRYMG
jgi:hypothetical protein